MLFFPERLHRALQLRLDKVCMSGNGLQQHFEVSFLSPDLQHFSLQLPQHRFWSSIVSHVLLPLLELELQAGHQALEIDERVGLPRNRL